MAKAKSTSARTATPGSIAQENPPLTAEERYRMIAEAAYFRAEKRGFLGGNVAEDWLEAEAEIDRMLREQGRLPSMTPEEIEAQITVPIETELLGIPHQSILRSTTKYAISDITLDFDEGTDIYWARQQVSERIAGRNGHSLFHRRLSPGYEPDGAGGLPLCRHGLLQEGG